MPSLEQIIYEAKEAGRRSRQNSSESRRPSIVVDDAGCVVQRGFFIPGSSRSSSQSSLSRTATNSSFASSNTPSTPATPIESPQPGYARPPGSLWNSPELTVFRNKSSSSLQLPPTRKWSSSDAQQLRPGVGYRVNSSQHTSRLSIGNSCWDDEELETGRCKIESGTALAAMAKAAELQAVKPEQLSRQPSAPITMMAPQALRPVLPRRTKSDQPHHQSRIKKKRNSSNKVRFSNARIADNPPKNKKQQFEVVPKEVSENAIASDSEDEEEEVCLRDRKPAQSSIAAQSSRPSYAVRRARSDEKAVQASQLNSRVPESPTFTDTAPSVTSQAEKCDPTMTLSQLLELACKADGENAIASNTEDDEETSSNNRDDNISAALGLAQYHCSQNSASGITFVPVTRQGEDDASKYTADLTIATSDVAATESAGKSSNSSLSVKVVQPGETNATRPGHSTTDEPETPRETPIEVKSFEKDSPMPKRHLRPSRSQPKPPKGVLKKSGSPPSPPDRHARAHVRQGSGEVVDGKFRPHKYETQCR